MRLYPPRPLFEPQARVSSHRHPLSAYQHPFRAPWTRLDSPAPLFKPSVKYCTPTTLPRHHHQRRTKKTAAAAAGLEMRAPSMFFNSFFNPFNNNLPTSLRVYQCQYTQHPFKLISPFVLETSYWFFRRWVAEIQGLRDGQNGA